MKRYSLIAFIIFVLISITAFLYLNGYYQEKIIEDNVSEDKSENDNDENNIALLSEEVTARIKLFVDSKGVGAKSEGDEECNNCNGKVFVVSPISDKPILTLQQLQTTTVSNDNTTLVNINSPKIAIWGYWSDRDTFLPYQEIDVTTVNEDLWISVRRVKSDTLGKNANISNITIKEKSNEKVEVNYVFSKLLPSFITAFEKQENIWVQFSPDESNLDIYFIAPGKIKRDITGEITGINGEYYMEVNWNIKDIEDAKITNKDLIRFILL
jgi:hypothetical protein